MTILSKVFVMNICNITNDFDFDKLTLAQPNGLQGGSYFTQLLLNESPIYIQGPACQTKQGLVTSGKKTYCDLMFTDNNEGILDWFENLEKNLIDKIFDKRDLWFHNNLERDDIENSFTSIMRVYKGGKFYLVRTNLAKAKHSLQKPFTCYDEQENQVDPETIKDQTIKVIPLLEIQGVKFSTKSFQIEICLRQIMVLDDKQKFGGCLIKNSQQSEPLESTKDDNEYVGESVNADNLDTLEEVSVGENDNADKLDTLEEVSVGENDNADKLDTLEVNKEIINETIISNNIDDNLVEINFTPETIDNNETMKLKKPNAVYFEMWKEARATAKLARKETLIAYLKAKNIKATYMLDELDEDSSDEFDIILDDLSESEEINGGLGI